MKKHLPNREKVAVKVSILLNRLKLSTVNRVTSCKDITNALMEVRKKRGMRDEPERPIVSEVGCTPQQIPNTRKIEPEKDVDPKNKSQPILRKPDKPYIINNEKIVKVNSKSTPPKPVNAQSPFKESNNNTKENPDAGNKAERNKNEQIVVKHNLPLFTPPQRERYNMIPTTVAASKQVYTKKVMDQEAQTEIAYVVTKDDYEMIQVLKASQVNMESLTSTIELMNNNIEDHENHEQNSTANNTNEVIDISDSEENTVLNSDLMSKLENQSDQNKALLQIFYRPTGETTLKFDPLKYSKIVNTSTLINQILVKDGDKVNNIQPSKSLGNKNTTAEMIARDTVLVNNNPQPTCNEFLHFSPVSDISSCDGQNDSVNETYVENTPSSFEMPIDENELQTVPTKLIAPVFSNSGNYLTQPHAQFGSRAKLNQTQPGASTIQHQNSSNQHFQMNQRMNQNQFPIAQHQQNGLFIPPQAQMSGPYTPYQQYSYPHGNNTMSHVPKPSNLMTNNGQHMNNYSPCYQNNGLMMNDMSLPQLTGTMQQQPVSNLWDVPQTMQATMPETVNNCLRPRTYFAHSPAMGATLSASTNMVPRHQEYQIQPEPVKTTRGRARGRGRPRGSRNSAVSNRVPYSRHAPIPSENLRLPEQQQLNKYQLLMEQQKRKEMDIQQRKWNQG